MSRPSSRRIPPGKVVVALLLALVASVAWPLATYTLTLATFGLAHVLAELRYVDLRFGRGLGRSLGGALLVTLLGVAATRAASMGGLLGRGDTIVIELCLGLTLVALVIPTVVRTRPWAGIVALTIALCLSVAILTAPALALLVIAVLHNFTPAAFALEATSGAGRRRAARLIVVVFVALPMLIVSGQAWELIDALHIAAPEASPLGYGPLQEAMGAYLPEATFDPMLALHLFSACVFLQCVHHGCVIVVLPRFLEPGAAGRLTWPVGRCWYGLLAATSLAIIGYAFDFERSREAYGVFAAVHAWVEMPILLLALLGTQARTHP